MLKRKAFMQHFDEKELNETIESIEQLKKLYQSPDIGTLSKWNKA